MTEDMLEILMYVFDQCSDKSFNMDNKGSIHRMTEELLSQGYCSNDIEEGLRWLEETQDGTKHARLDEPKGGMRIYHPEEFNKLSPRSRAFLYTLEANGLISPSVRELIIDRAMTLNAKTVDLEECKWIAAIVLYNYTHDNLADLEELMFYDFDNATMH